MGNTEAKFLGQKINPQKYFQLKTDVTPQPNAEGLIQWNATENTVDVGLEGGAVTGQLFEEMFVRGVNKTGSILTEGQVVYSPGRQGNKPKFDLARSDSEATSVVLGVLTMDIPINGFGRCTTFGYVRQIKTNYTGTGIRGTTWAEGDKLYVSKTTAGQLTNVEPSAPHHSDCIGEVSIVGSAGVGAIFVNIDRHKTLEELSDVNGTAPVEGSIPSYHATEGYWDFDKNINDYAKLVDLQNFELVLARKTSGNSYMEYTEVGGNITQVNYWTNNLKETKLFTKDITYSGSNPTQIVMKDEITNKILTTTIAYSGDDIVSVTKVLS